MQELLLITNRRTRLRVTAFGGAVIGVLLGVCTTFSVGYSVYSSQQGSMAAREAALIGSYDKQVSTLATQIKRMETTSFCEPLDYVAKAQELHVRQIADLVAKFPAFKTEPFKSINADLNQELSNQIKSTQALRSALVTLDGNSSLCGVAKPGGSSESIWTDGVATLHKDGWRGIPQ